MLHSGDHIVRSWKREYYALRIILAALLPAVFLFAAALYLHVSIGTISVVLGESLYRVIASYVLSLIIGVSVALLVANGKHGGEAWVAVFDVAQNIPSFALIPLFILLMGYSNTMIIAFAATSIVWPIIFSTLSAARAAHPSLHEAATLFGARGWRRIYYYLLPLSYPAIISGSIVGVAMGWESVIGAEIIGSFSGIGTYLNTASNHGNTVALVAGLSALLLVIFIINRLVWSPLLKRTYAYSE